MVIYKSTDYRRTWIPFQFYSSACRKIYGRSPRATVARANEQEPMCTDPAATVASATTGPDRIAFVALEGRPSAAEFDGSPVLQDWVTATDIRVEFHRPTLLVLI